MKIRETIEALLKENHELRMQLAARGYLHTDHSGREAGVAALREMDEAIRRMAEAMIRKMEPMPYDPYDDPERE